MSRFTSNPTLALIAPDDLSHKKRYILMEDLHYAVGNEDSTFIIIVPKGFITDLATSPRFMWWYIAPFGPHNNATILHDFTYTIGVDRALADGLLRESLKVLQIPLIRRNLMFWAVRLFGWYYYYGLNKKKFTWKLQRRRAKDLAAERKDDMCLSKENQGV